MLPFLILRKFKTLLGGSVVLVNQFLIVLSVFPVNLANSAVVTPVVDIKYCSISNFLVINLIGCLERLSYRFL